MDYTKFNKDLFRNINKSVVGALVTDTTRIHLFHTENLSLYLAQLFTSVKNKKHSNTELYKDRNKLRLIILETCPGVGGDEKWDLHYWYTHYKSLGFSFYSDSPPITIIPIISVTTRGILVQLRNRAYNRFTIGVFDSIVDAEDFVDHFHKNSLAPVWACNKLTSDYFSK